MRLLVVVPCLLAALAVSVSGHAWNHPRELTLVKHNLLVGTLDYVEHPLMVHRRLAAFQGQRTIASSLGQYLLTVNLNGFTAKAVIDTGSGINQVACKGVKNDPAYPPISTLDPAAAKPALIMVKKTDATCKPYCTLSTGCINPPALANACEYEYDYVDNSWLFARVYQGQAVLPAAAGTVAPKIAPFYFGCTYQTSTKPYMYSTTNSLFGMDWEPTSFWGQVLKSKLVNDTTLYLCMGNGVGTDSKQAGLIVFGTDTAVSIKAGTPSAAVASDVVTMNMVNGLALGQAVPSMWVQMTGLAFGSRALSVTLNGLYMVDSGTSALVLLQREFNALNAVFCNTLRNLQAVFSCDDTSAADYGYNVTMVQVYTPAQLDGVLPSLSFTFKTGSKPVVWKPSQYMIFDSGTSYSVNIESTSDNSGLLGNAWMNGWLFQQTQANYKLKMTRVKSCNDILY